MVRVGPITGGEPHLLLGHESRIKSLAVDPLGRWIAFGKPGHHRAPVAHAGPCRLRRSIRCPVEELIAKLESLTNVRAVRDESSPTGWKLTHEPFSGWETVPTW